VSPTVIFYELSAIISNQDNSFLGRLFQLPVAAELPVPPQYATGWRVSMTTALMATFLFSMAAMVLWYRPR